MSLATDSFSRHQTQGAAANVARPQPSLALDAQMVSGADWDRIASRFDGICQEQLFAYASTRWPGVTLEPVVFSDAGGPVGGALVMLQPLPLKLATIALIKWGPILADAQRGDADAVMATMVDHIVADYAQGRGMMVSIMPKVEPSTENKGFAALLARGFSRGVELQFPDRYVVDVRLADEERLAAFGQKWRYHLRKALKAGLTFEQGEPDDIERFMTLYRAMSDRKLFPDHSAIDTLGGLLAMPDGTARPEMFFVSRDGETVAGAVIFTAGDTATYLYGATSDAALDLRAGYFLHWHIIRWLRDHTRAVRYDLGGTDGFQGLHQFKAGMVGEAGFIVPTPPVANYAARPLALFAGTFAYRAREALNRTKDRLHALRLAAQRRRKKP